MTYNTDLILCIEALYSRVEEENSDEWAYIISGEWQESETVYSKGTLFHAPKGKKHGPHIAKTDVISLTHFDGPLTVE